MHMPSVEPGPEFVQKVPGLLQDKAHGGILEKEGVVTLSSTEENKKTKYITLTEKGIEMVEKFIKPLMIAELAAFEMMGKEETREYLRLNKIYAETLNLTISKLGLDD